MTNDLKITLVGAGSPTFTPFLFKGLFQGRLRAENNIEVSMMDVDEKVLRGMQIVLEKIQSSLVKSQRDKEYASIKISKHTDLKESLAGAHFVVTTVGVGGFKATQADIDIPARLDIFQSIGDTVGPGGVFRGLRHIPVVFNVAKTMEDVCPDAYLFNYTNPMTPITRAANRETKIKTYGLCTSVWHTRKYLARYLGVDAQDLDMTIAGVNHLCFITELKVGGASLMERIVSGRFPPRFGRVGKEIFDLLGLVPYAGGRHTSEFFPNLYSGKSNMRKYDLLPNMLTVLDLKDREPVEKMLKSISSGKEDADTLLSTPGWEEEGIGVVKIIETLRSGGNTYFAGINAPNNGMISDLPDWAIVEIPAAISGDGIALRKIGKLPPDITGILFQRIMQYEQLVDAALSGERKVLLRCLQLDGYIKSLEQGRRLANQMLVAERKWLPPYWFGGKNGVKSS